MFIYFPIVRVEFSDSVDIDTIDSISSYICVATTPSN